MKRIGTKRIFFLGLIFLWMGLIFYFSHQDADVSTEQGSSVSSIVEDIFFPEWKNTLPEEEYRVWQGHLSFLVRKAAHCTEYAVLGILLALFVTTWPLSWWVQWLIVIGAGFLYALSDEFHQAFVPGRDCTAFDMVVDTIGVTLGSIITLGIGGLMTLTKSEKRV